MAVLETNYQVLTQVDRFLRRRPIDAPAARILDRLDVEYTGNSKRLDEVRRVQALAAKATAHPLTDAESQEIRNLLAEMIKQSRDDYAVERQKLWQLRESPAYRRLR